MRAMRYVLVGILFTVVLAAGVFLIVVMWTILGAPLLALIVGTITA